MILISAMKMERQFYSQQQQLCSQKLDLVPAIENFYIKRYIFCFFDKTKSFDKDLEHWDKHATIFWVTYSLKRD